MWKVISNILSCPWHAKVTLKCRDETMNTVLGIDYSGIQNNPGNGRQQIFQRMRIISEIQKNKK